MQGPPASIGQPPNNSHVGKVLSWLTSLAVSAMSPFCSTAASPYCGPR
jgi:hypothetical protein